MSFSSPRTATTFKRSAGFMKSTKSGVQISDFCRSGAESDHPATVVSPNTRRISSRGLGDCKTEAKNSPQISANGIACNGECAFVLVKVLENGRCRDGYKANKPAAAGTTKIWRREYDPFDLNAKN